MRAAADRGQLNFHGNVEGNDIFKGTVDVVVCDGFVGNVALKTSEGLAQMMGGFIREEFKRNPLSMLAALIAMPVLNRFRHRVDHRRYNGASLLGLRGLVDQEPRVGRRVRVRSRARARLRRREPRRRVAHRRVDGAMRSLPRDDDDAGVRRPRRSATRPSEQVASLF